MKHEYYHQTHTQEREHRLKQGAYMREYGASEIMLAVYFGEYPPPHAAMDERVSRGTFDFRGRP